MKEITGSGIFVANGEDDPAEAGSANPPSNKTGLRMYQVLFFYIDIENKKLMLILIVLITVLQWISANLYFYCLMLKIEASYCGNQSYLFWRGRECFTEKAHFIA